MTAFVEIVPGLGIAKGARVNELARAHGARKWTPGNAWRRLALFTLLVDAHAKAHLYGTSSGVKGLPTFRVDVRELFLERFVFAPCGSTNISVIAPIKPKLFLMPQ